jgi:REP element-mobilizing transposase RayT
MSQPRKLLFNKTVIFVTTAIEEGLPLPPNALINSILLSIIARAQTLYPVRVCHFLFEANHLHMILVVDNPDDVKDFMCRLKTESAHAINRLLGKDKHTIWCEGYDSPTVLTADDVIREIVYLYTNPAKDGLEDSITKYPGLSSWQMFTTKQHTVECPWIQRHMITKLKHYSLTAKQAHTLAKQLQERARYLHTFSIEPNAWMECFGVLEQQQQEELNQRVIAEVQAVERGYRRERKRKGGKVIGAKKLMQRSINVHYIPQRAGQRSWCICKDAKLRIGFIELAKALVEAACAVYQSWKAGDYTAKMPLGLYAPALPKRAELITSTVSCW